MRQFGWVMALATWAAALAIGFAAAAHGQAAVPSGPDPLSLSEPGLPDSPGVALGQTGQLPQPQSADSPDPWWMTPPNPQSPVELGLPAPCPSPGQTKSGEGVSTVGPCRPVYKPFVDVDKHVPPMTTRQKAKLALHDVKDTFNLLTIAGTSAYFIGTTPHNPYGPGMRGFGYNAGVSLSEDVMGETIGTFAVCSLFHQDPRYSRMPHASIPRRVWHAVARVAVAQGDNGKTIPNYANFITSAALAVITNTYVPGLATDPASTTERIFDGYLTEPIGTLIAEFLPDIASHIHVRVVLMQRILNQISGQGQQGGGGP